MSLKHERKLSIATTFETGITERQVYQPGTLETIDVLSDFRYAGTITALELLISCNSPNTLELWLKDANGNKIILDDNLKILPDRPKQNLIELLSSQGKISLGSRLALMATLLYPERMRGSDQITILGFAQEEGLPTGSIENQPLSSGDRVFETIASSIWGTAQTFSNIIATEKGKANGIATLGSDRKIPSEQLPPIQIAIPTLAEIGAEPQGAEIRAKAYADERITALPPFPSLTQLGGEPIGAESRAKNYADQKFAQVPLQIFPNSLTHWWGYAKPPTGKSFTTSVNATFEFARISVLVPPAQGDTVEFSGLLAAGNYRLMIIHDRFTDRGIAAIYVSNQLIGTTDCYSPSYAPINRVTMNFSISNAGLQFFKVITEGKNAASSNFNLAITAILINPN